MNVINVFPSAGGCGLPGRTKEEDFYVVYYNNTVFSEEENVLSLRSFLFFGQIESTNEDFIFYTKCC